MGCFLYITRMPTDCERISLGATDGEAEKPATRWELSPRMGIDGYNYNVAVLESDERLSENAYHYHENQSELFHVVTGACRVETERDSFDVETDELAYFAPGVTHLLHNPFEDPCKLIAVGHPPEGRYPVRQEKSYEQLLAERYPDGDATTPSTEV